ncbi:MAG: branched-chain amino acid ABC transporter permease [Acetobacteraceae bacterium]|nr:branched-chain amino acid ABC transporter permease [Acetobacteraceae bacterium]
MDASTLLILLQDGIVNGAIYALLALSLVLVFAVTRIIFIPAGEIVAYGALAFAALDQGRLPGCAWLLLGLGAAAFVAGLFQERGRRALFRLAAETLLLPCAAVLLARALAPFKLGAFAEAALAVLLVAPLAPLLYRVAFQPLAEASVLVLLIAALGVHLVLVGLGLAFFGPEGFGAPTFSDAQIALGPVQLSGQALWVLGATAALMLALALFLDGTLTGKALRATAVNRFGARLCGIGTAAAGRLAFALAGVIGALSGVLVAPLTTIYYDSGFLIGLKGFVAAIVAGLVSFPGAALAAVAVGCVESFASFYASAYKEVIVFAVIIPVLLWRSLRGPVEEE